MEKKIYITSGIFALLVISLMLFFIWPLFLSIKNNSENLLSIKNNAALLKLQNQEIENFKKIYPDYQSNLAIMESAFLEKDNPIDFIKFLENTARDSGSNPKISLLPGALQGNQNRVTFQVFFSDDFLKIMDFCNKLEGGPYAITIENIAIKSSNQDATSKNYPSGKVDATFSIHAFVKQ